MTPFANNGFIKKDFHVLEKSVGGRACGPSLPSLASENSALGPLSSHRGPYELPQASFSPTGISQARLAHSLWQLQAWQVASQAHLGCLLESWVSDVEEAGVEDFQKERPRRECLRPPEVLEIPGNELRASKKKKKKRQSKNCTLSPGIQHFCPEKDFSKTPPFLHLDLKEALGQAELAGGRVGEWQKEEGRETEEPPPSHSRICSNLE